MVDVATIVGIVVAHAITLGVLGYLLRGRTARARREAKTGDLILEYSWRAKGFVIVFAALITAMFTILLAVIGPPKPSDVPIVASMVLLFGGPLSLLAIEFFGTVVRVNSEGIRRRSGWTGRRSVRWGDVRSISFSESMGWWRLRSEYGTIRVGAFLSGVPEFLAFARQRVPSDRWTGLAPKSWLYRV